MQHGLLIEGGIHHLDQLRNLCGADCQTIAGWDWNPGHARGETATWRTSDAFDGEACALLVLRPGGGAGVGYIVSVMTLFRLDRLPRPLPCFV
jgi:predicted dehydrogenase